MMGEAEKGLRAQIVAEAKTWIGTPYHHEGRIKAAGVDCGMLILEVFEKVGLLPHIEVEHYPQDFMLHRSEEWYLKIVLENGFEIFKTPLPGDVVLYRSGRIYAHGGIVINWPTIVHACVDEKKVSIANALITPLLNKKRRLFRHSQFEGE
jgi:cell wall-associated NlpC family hydrolase